MHLIEDITRGLFLRLTSRVGYVQFQFRRFSLTLFKLNTTCPLGSTKELHRTYA
jgi:hypothetical protein